MNLQQTDAKKWKLILIALGIHLLVVVSQIALVETAQAMALPEDLELERSCLIEYPHIERHLLSGTEGYFSQPLGNDRVMMNGRWASRINVNQTRAKIYNLKTRRTTEITRGIDPYPTLDGKYYVHPVPVRFFKVEDLDRGDKDAKPVAEFKDHTGWYQSVGQLSNSNGETIYRVLTGEGQGVINDYREQDGKIVATGKPTKLCNNLVNRGDLDWALPMMSRDGRRFATISPVTKTTLIFDITMPGGHCRQIADLGFGTSKVSFSYDGSMVTFPAHIAGMKNRAALVFDISSGTYEPVFPPSESVDTYFSTFFPDGSVGVLSFKKDFMSRTSRKALGPDVSSMGEGLPVLEVERDLQKRVPATESQTKFAIAMILNCPNYSTVHPDWISRFLFREKCEALRAKHPKEFGSSNCQALPAYADGRKGPKHRTTR